MDGSPDGTCAVFSSRGSPLFVQASKPYFDSLHVQTVLLAITVLNVDYCLEAVIGLADRPRLGQAPTPMVPSFLFPTARISQYCRSRGTGWVPANPPCGFTSILLRNAVERAWQEMRVSVLPAPTFPDCCLDEWPSRKNGSGMALSSRSPSGCTTHSF